MFRITAILLVSILICNLSFAQAPDNKVGPEPDPVIKECATAEDCVRFSHQSTVKKDYYNALIYITTAANMGSDDGQYRLGKLYENGILERIDYQVGHILDNNGHYVARGPDLKLAYKWLKIADLNGNKFAKHSLKPLWHKIKTQINRRRSNVIGRTASSITLTHEEVLNRQYRSAYADICTDIATKYVEGDALPQDYAAALRYFRVGIAERIPDAFIGMAKLYEHGHGVERDRVKAYILARKYRSNYGEHKNYHETLKAKLSVGELEEAMKRLKEEGIVN